MDWNYPSGFPLHSFLTVTPGNFTPNAIASHYIGRKNTPELYPAVA